MEIRPILYDDELKKAIALNKQAYASESFIGNFENAKSGSLFAQIFIFRFMTIKRW